jgi:hypothetical protein
MMLRPALPLVALLALALPAQAAAATWRGTTKQGRGILVYSGGDGLVERAKIGWRARCDEGGTYSSRTIFVAPFDVSEPVRFADEGSYDGRPPGYRATIVAGIRGSYFSGVDRWRGTFHVRVAVFKDGKRVDTCRLKRVRWSAGRG